MPASEARIAANRANAQKSTGPKTAEGKARSRQNSLRHGLSGTGVVLHPEDQAVLAGRRAAWGDCLRPRDALEAYLVDRAAVRSVQLDRAARNDSARALAAIREADADFAAGLTLRLEAAEAEARAWTRLAEVLDRVGHLPPEPFERARHLLGLTGPHDPRAADLAALNREAAATPTPLPVALLAVHPEPEPADSRPVPGRPEARAALARILHARRTLALDHADRIRDDLASPEAHALALAVAEVDTSPEAHLLRRYETACELGLFRVLNFLRKRAGEDQPRPDPIEEPDHPTPPISWSDPGEWKADAGSGRSASSMIPEVEPEGASSRLSPEEPASQPPAGSTPIDDSDAPPRPMSDGPQVGSLEVETPSSRAPATTASRDRPAESPGRVVEDASPEGATTPRVEPAALASSAPVTIRPSWSGDLGNFRNEANRPKRVRARARKGSHS